MDSVLKKKIIKKSKEIGILQIDEEINIFMDWLYGKNFENLMEIGTFEPPPP
jgi:hypothetical protein